MNSQNMLEEMVYYFVFKAEASLKKNSRSGSKKNISFHYDLGNSFYEKWLDESMTYSSAMFKDPRITFIRPN